ncbi:MAG: hypothetical protein ACD_39C00113G0002 [uncultured bacterium]|nr:MAG: hypothetical protein ACD_39C00113G0002 [uncultured bacterium]
MITRELRGNHLDNFVINDIRVQMNKRNIQLVTQSPDNVVFGYQRHLRQRFTELDALVALKSQSLLELLFSYQVTIDKYVAQTFFLRIHSIDNLLESTPARQAIS